jgi:hypothetical protein
MLNLRNTTLVLGLLVGSTVAAAAANTKTLGNYGAWQAYSYPDGGGTVCYATAAASRQQGGEAKRKPIYLAVTNREKARGEVSVIGTWGFKKESDLDLEIGKSKFTFFTKGDSAWVKQAGADPAVVAALLRGRDAVVRATPAKGSAIVDTVSLNGFGKALAAIDKACSVKKR